ncbi:MAG: TIGR03617 family F420-dependent LLM class oxidoreductase [Deltaproteobacteria bacterium]|nr:TIGR03617 family F420-dependent LLM class oxidoreductase [Deltaproteobacteria bacterium]
MRVEATLTAPGSLAELIRHGKRLDEAGYDTILVPEAGHDPFLPAMILAEHTRRARLGTGVAIAFPRSPFVTAQLAWDLQRFSEGRFVLSLGTQVKGHNERRYSTPWPSPPGPRLREYVLCLRAIIEHFRTGAKPDFVGEHYQFTLCNPFFNPGPIPGVEGLPIYVAAVNRINCRVAGELCDGLRMHPLNSPAYVREVIRPAVEEGLSKSGRSFDDIDLCLNPFMATGETQADVEEAKGIIRRHISFYTATRTYFTVLEHHGWLDVGEEMVALSKQGRWDEMPGRVPDEMLEELALIGTYDEIAGQLEKRYAGLVTTINPVFGPPYPEYQERQRRMFESLGPIMADLRAVR